MSKDVVIESDSERNSMSEEILSYDEFEQKPLKLRPYGNAGVKGVINDYKEAREHAEQRLKQRVEETKKIMRGEFSNSIIQEKCEEDDLDEIEKELFGEVISAQVFKERQKPEVLKKIVKRRYGDVLELDEEEYANTITTLEDDVFAVIHIYTTFVKDCTLINRMMEEYAQKYPFVCFAKITWEDSNKPFPEKSLPGLLIYKGDCMVKSLFGSEAFPFLRDIFPGLLN
ncbi:phlp1, putative [Entamoeba dispar SAW760]|uniref:Phlp1, putative n=1 Tax=Entamoeba dispar (strain ATCC PRA-260 / SAW760) TaxID=370354 RepID=B0EGD7_ENTDS|nr:phlp1, putative [Entamoeba dispar SAW760]EDR26413.1 phlp1, putative [Entamoeba dispar SAW760]|eukprot:EDR26413.1 phlp1, putative [Entamoeba dispar SAW760]